MNPERYILSVSLGKRRNDPKRSLRAYSLMAFPIWIVSIPITFPACQLIAFVRDNAKYHHTRGPRQAWILGEIWLEVGKYKIIDDSLFRIGLL